MDYYQLIIFLKIFYSIMIKESFNNYEKNDVDNIKLSPINQFIKFQKDFDILLKELINEYEKLKNYFLRILYIKIYLKMKTKIKKKK
jgi:hypothetical protein